MPNPINILPGERYGKLTIIAEAEEGVDIKRRDRD